MLAKLDLLERDAAALGGEPWMVENLRRSHAEARRLFEQIPEWHQVPVAPDLRDHIIETGYRGGRTLADVGSEWGMSRENVRKILKRRGVPTRPYTTTGSPRRRRVGSVGPVAATGDGAEVC